MRPEFDGPVEVPVRADRVEREGPTGPVREPAPEGGAHVWLADQDTLVAFMLLRGR
ncbi:MAG TPA: hypothetical protein VGR06_00965 [Actinophytocola sp.]|jgi:hypothetical protein|uniref:hypothetical protein n=1 Tax=Actinophytocola sp. TaxID=1872138 RepID=UPI002E09FE01|nr:hypothetical protein [Actinophytocola sp.]